ncbi:hypothetical protein [Methylobacterium sp. SyP6R]|uniref:hypothetical protein n=1 Tax=Methylobacterium sp. SyP6R TaxID=2718876 RepID=UPI001F24A781|nr:hypothetical protein [Methylobacterium sp. SyP6R]MCF4127905.1 hypothetical protein [Methylobacterium sp. SyP6R]
MSEPGDQMGKIREGWRKRMERARDEADAALQDMLDKGMDPNHPGVKYAEGARDRAAAAVEELTPKAG